MLLAASYGKDRGWHGRGARNERRRVPSGKREGQRGGREIGVLVTREQAECLDRGSLTMHSRPLTSCRSF